MLKWFTDWLDSRRRTIDIQLLWPAICKASERDLDQARAAFYTHAMIDPAWQSLDHDDVVNLILKLEMP
jgi:hypothetical protein